MRHIMAVFFILCTMAVPGSEIVWPINIEISQSSSFAEFRGMRLHAGIDLRTQRKNGFPVVAIADGFISRASVQFRGYGYALYIDHPELKVRVVYGHLQDFQGPVKEYADLKLKKMGSRHGINDFFPADRFPVKKGQVVALSGETGMGPSHLHFEMRTFADEPVAPALYGYRPDDSIPPVFHHLHIEPMSHACFINGSFLPSRFVLRKKSADVYRLDSIPEICGKFALQAGVSDTNGLGNRYGVEKTSLTMGDKLLIERIFHRYSYDDNRQCPWVYDYFKSNQQGTGYVVNLFKLPCETLPIAAGFPAWSGVVNPDSGKNIFRIVAEDFGGNIVSAEGTINAATVDFSRTFSAEELAAFKFVGVEQTDYSLVAVGLRQAVTTDKSLQTGRVSCSDKTGKAALLECIVSPTRIEIAFPKEIKWQLGAWIGETRVLPDSIMIEPKGGVVAMEPGGNAMFSKNSLHQPMFCRMVKTNLKPAPGGSAKRGYLKPFSAIWRLTPDDKVFDAEVKISIKPDEYSGNMQKLGVYSVAGEGKYSHNGEKVENGALVFTSRTGGSYVILEDILSPVITYNRKSSDYHLGPVYVFNITDLGKGIDYLSANATINGKSVEVYSDPDKAEIYVARPEGSKHLIELQVKDQAGNPGKITRSL